MRNKYRRPWSDTARYAQHLAQYLTKAYDICTSIRHLFADDVIIYCALTLWMLGNFFQIFVFFKIFKKFIVSTHFILLIYNLNVKHFGSQMRPHILWGFIWIQIVCKGHQRSSKFTASGLRVKHWWGIIRHMLNIRTLASTHVDTKHLSKVSGYVYKNW